MSGRTYTNSKFSRLKQIKGNNMKQITGILLSSKVHLLRVRGGHLVSACGSERRVYGVSTGARISCEKCKGIVVKQPEPQPIN